MARKRGQYTGQQYRGGRQKGEKNLVRVDGGFQNQHGVVFSEAERKALTNAVNTANRKRARMLKQEGSLPWVVDGKDTGDTLASKQRMGYESDFILAPKSKSLQRFRNRKEFESYMLNLERVNDRNYINKRTEQYRENYLTGLDRAFGDDAADIKKAIGKMSPAKYRELVAQHDEDLEIQFLYDDKDRTAKLNRIRNAMGLPSKEAAEPDETYNLKRAAKKTNRRKR